jgi:Meckelin (Transmembrane protein 67)
LIKTDDLLLPDQSDLMFELYLADSKGNLIEIPVVLNQTGEASKPMSEWQLVKRFFIVDTLTGRDKNSNEKLPEYVRWANDVKLKI